MNRAPRPKDRIWVLYVNDKKVNWQQICELGKYYITPRDSLTWKFEMAEENQVSRK